MCLYVSPPVPGGWWHCRRRHNRGCLFYVGIQQQLWWQTVFLICININVPLFRRTRFICEKAGERSNINTWGIHRCHGPQGTVNMHHMYSRNGLAAASHFQTFKTFALFHVQTICWSMLMSGLMQLLLFVFLKSKKPKCFQPLMREQQGSNIHLHPLSRSLFLCSDKSKCSVWGERWGSRQCIRSLPERADMDLGHQILAEANGVTGDSVVQTEEKNSDVH